MSVFWYDKSIVDKLKEITQSTTCSIIGTANLFRYLADNNEDDVTFPVVSLTRLGYVVKNTTRSTMSAQGFKFAEQNNILKEVQFAPITLTYRLDIIAKSREDNDMITDEILLYFINNPTLIVNVEKGLNFNHNFNISIGQSVTDNSQIESFFSNGEYFRTTLDLSVSDAYLWKSTSKPKFTNGLVSIVSVNNTPITEELPEELSE